jgi:hypothetical protein
MAVKSYDLRVNADGTLTIKVGRAVETIGLLGKERGEIFDQVKWALISKDVYVSEVRLTEDLYEVIWRHL